MDALWVVRPDGYVGLAARRDDAAAAEAYLAYCGLKRLTFHSIMRIEHSFAHFHVAASRLAIPAAAIICCDAPRLIAR
jgi:hypothetical protein